MARKSNQRHRPTALQLRENLPLLVHYYLFTIFEIPAALSANQRNKKMRMYRRGESIEYDLELRNPMVHILLPVESCPRFYPCYVVLDLRILLEILPSPFCQQV